VTPQLLRPLLGALVVAAGLGAWGLHRVTSGESLELGGQLFVGDVALKGHVTGDDTSLPSDAVRCANCHVEREGSGPSERFGPALDASSLLRPVRRRGGPASSYDPVSFCRLLREGIDPAQIVIPKAMPRYIVSEQECQALWTYVTSR
jgi:hypothetical protein